jgi:phosphoglycerate dehydrogenase-like enzyme
MNPRPVIVVEDDPFPRLLQAFLDAHDDPRRTAAIADFVAHDIPDYPGWLAQARAQAPGLYPAEVRLVSTQAALHAALPGAHAVVTETLEIGAAELALAGQLRVVQKYGTVLRNIDTAACAARGIKILTVRRRANIGCAEYAFGLMIMLAKRLHQSANLLSMEQLEGAGFKPRHFDRRYTSNSNWARIGGMRNLCGSTMGIIGLGEIGREMAVRAHAFGMKTLYYQRTRWPEAVEREWHADYCPLEELLGASDWVCPTLPLTEQSRHLLDATRLAQMKRGAMLVNISRAEIVERHALHDALASGHLGGLGLDTFYEEPARSDDPLLKFRQVIITLRIAAQPRYNAFGDLAQVMSGLVRTLGETS